ncbi:MAG: hypothetical protein M1600_15260, partial [Firmicutes bacterium]|nr:hypothetical protein [Bacillota bacterium]
GGRCGLKLTSVRILAPDIRWHLVNYTLERPILQRNDGILSSRPLAYGRGLVPSDPSKMVDPGRLAKNTNER